MGGETWNPITGCTKISPACQNCYAERMAKRLAGRYGYPEDDPFRPGTFHPDKIDINMFSPGKLVFVCSMADLFHEAVNIRGEEMRSIFRVMAAHQDNTFLLLTKRPERMAECIKYLYGDDFPEIMPHVWCGTTVENQEWADKRIPHLLQIPASVRFVSVEPMLGVITLSWYLGELPPLIGGNDIPSKGLDWVICGGETGPGSRPMHPDWARSLRDQCAAAGVSFFMKQMSKKAPIPEDLMIREMPNAK